jgi:hypothetical protein
MSVNSSGAQFYVGERYDVGLNYAAVAFTKNTVLTDSIKDLATRLAANTQPLQTVNLISPPTYSELDVLFNLSAPTAPTLDSFPALPAAPAPPSLQFGYAEDPYVSNVDDSLKAAVKTQIDAGGTGLGAVVEDGIWNRERERALLEHNDSIARMADEAAGFGFPMPDGVLAAGLIDLETKYTDARLTSSRDIATKQAEIAHDQETKILEIGTAYEGMKETYATSMRNRLLDAAKAGPQIAVDMFKAQVEYVNVYIAQYNAIATKANAQSEIFKSQVMSYSAQIDAKAKVVNASVEKYSADVDGVFKANQTEIAKDQLFLTQLTAFLNLQLEAMKAVSQVNAQIAASALTGMSASASIGDTASDSSSVQVSSSNSTFNETITYA